MADGQQELAQLKREGFSPESGPEAWVDRNLGNIGTVAGFLDPFTEPAELTAALGKTIAGDVTDPASGATVQLSHPKQEKAEIAAAEAKKKASAQQKAYEYQLQQIANNPWSTAANALSQSFQSDLAAVAPDISGASIPGAQTSAASQAAGDLGLPAMSPGAQWLAQGASDAQAQTQGVAGAMNAEAQTYANAAGPITKAITQWGADNAIGEITAPEQAWLSALASHVTSNLSYQGQIPVADIPALPYSVATALKASGGYPGSSASGTEPLQDIVPGQGGQSKVGTNASALGGPGSPGFTPGTPGSAPGA
jgi:hypothetical protein